jgi:hypothetical protein
LKRAIYQFVQYLAASTFIGISVYGIIVYMGGNVNEKVPVATSLLLGLGAVVCIVIIVVMGGVLDRIMAQEGKGDRQSG